MYPSVEPQPMEAITTEQKLQRVDAEQIRPEREDDWFVLFDTIRQKAVAIPSGTLDIMQYTRIYIQRH